MKVMGEIDWDVSDGQVPYPEALARMEARIDAPEPATATADVSEPPRPNVVMRLAAVTP